MALILPEYLQTQKYAAIRPRSLMMDLPLQEGVDGVAGSLWPTPMKVSQRAAGANKTVDIAEGAAWIKGDASSRQGMYHVFNDAVVNLAVPDNATGNPRLDQVICRVHDTVDGGGLTDNAEFELLQGTPTVGATLDNRDGAASLPATAVRLADVLSGPGFTSITSSVILDRRPWARGARVVATRTSANGNSSTTANVAIFAADFNHRLEISSGLVRVQYTGVWQSTAAVYTVYFTARIDGVHLEERLHSNPTAAVAAHPFNHTWDLEVTPGSHVFTMGFRNNSAQNTTFYANAPSGQASGPLSMIVTELLRSSGHNS